jgi:hypothetical protein
LHGAVSSPVLALFAILARPARGTKEESAGRRAVDDIAAPISDRRIASGRDTVGLVS